MPPGVHSTGSYVVIFRDQHERKDIPGVLGAATGVVIFEPSMAARNAAEAAFIKAVELPLQHLTPAQAHLENHGPVFLQWNPAPLPGSADRRAVTACLGPATR